jgi:hypothetical protein
MSRIPWKAFVCNLTRLLLPCSAVLMFSLPLFPQGNNGTISGTVTDKTGGSLDGAKVTVTDVQRGTARTITTDPAGAYSAPNLTPSTYTVRVEFKGFKTGERTSVVLETKGSMRVDFSLEPGEQSETVTITEALPLIDTTTAVLGGTLSNTAINDLPLNGRNFQNLLTLRPGVTIYPGGGGWTQSTNGMRAHDNVYLVDGVNNNEPWTGQSIMNAAMAAGDAGTLLSVDAIDQFKTEQNPRAEYGWKPGSIVNVGVKSGTNSFRGTAFAFGRSDSFDARNYFNPEPNPVSPLNFQQFGGTFGGPIKKDKLFFFVNFEEQRYSVGNPFPHTGPITGGATAASNSSDGLIGACLATPAGNRAPLSLQLAGLSAACATLPNYPGLFVNNPGPTNDFQTAINSTNKIDSGLAKIDYHLNDKNVISGMYFISPGDGILVDNPVIQIHPLWLTNQYARSQIAAFNWAWIPNSKWVNEVRVGYSHYYQTFQSADSTENPANYSFNGATYHVFTGQTDSAYFGLPQIRFSSYSSYSLGASWPKTVGPDGVLHLLDHVSMLSGKHSFKFGGEFLDNRSDNNVTANAKGPLRFASLATFFTGIPNRANFLSGNLQRHMSSQGFALFAQDDWRMLPRVTVNLGLRYELNGVINERDNLLGNFDPAVGLVQVGKQVSSPYNGDHNNFSPRLGVAWDISGNGKTVVRGGIGLMYEQFTFDMFNALGNLLGLRMVPTGVALYSNGKQIQSPGTINVANISFTGAALNGTAVPGQVAFNWIHNSTSQPLYSIAPGCGDGSVTLPTGFTPQPCSVLGVDQNLRNPYITSWNVDVQRLITNNIAIDIAYVGNHGTKLVGLTDINQAPLGAGWTPAVRAACLASAPAFDNCAPNSDAEQAARPLGGKFPYLQYINILQNNNVSNYNGAQVTLTQHATHGLSLTAGYTFAHALDENSDNWSGWQIPLTGNQRLLYGSSNFDIRQRFTWTATYEIPGHKGYAQMLEGWSINSIVTLQTGLPWGVGDTANDFTGTGEINQPASSQNEQWSFFGSPSDFQLSHGFTQYNGDVQAGGTGGIPYFPGTSNAACLAKSTSLGPLAVAALANTGCFALGSSILVPPAFGTLGNTARNMFRDNGFKNWDFSVFKNFKFQEWFTAQFRVEFFNILNHVSFSNPGGPGGGAGTTDPSVGAGFGCGCVTPDTGGSNPVLGSGGARAMQLGLKLIF